jgi:hypothetical protein
MNITTVDIYDTDQIILTSNGKVVGIVKIENNTDFVHLRGQAVNVQNFNTHQFTHNLFGMQSSMNTDNPKEIENVGAFLEALKVAN